MEPLELPTAAMLREFVLQSDLKTEQLRTELRTEFGRVHTTLARLESQSQDHALRLARMERRLEATAPMMQTPMVLMVVNLLSLVIIGIAIGYVVLR